MLPVTGKLILLIALIGATFGSASAQAPASGTPKNEFFKEKKKQNTPEPAARPEPGAIPKNGGAPTPANHRGEEAISIPKGDRSESTPASNPGNRAAKPPKKAATPLKKAGNKSR